MTNAEPASIAEAFEWLRKAFHPEASDGLRVGYGLDLRGDAGGTLWILIDSGRLEMGEGPGRAMDVVFELDAHDFFGILSGRENPDLLFMAERLCIDGDLSLALKLRALFPRSG